MDIASQFTEIATALISDNLERLPGAIGLRPFHNGRHMVGVALTVRTRPGDNLAIHQVLELVKPGDVIVVDGGGAVDRALVGEIMVAIAAKRGARGFVLDRFSRAPPSIAVPTRADPARSICRYRSVGRSFSPGISSSATRMVLSDSLRRRLKRSSSRLAPRLPRKLR